MNELKALNETGLKDEGVSCIMHVPIGGTDPPLASPSRYWFGGQPDLLPANERQGTTMRVLFFTDAFADNNKACNGVRWRAEVEGGSLPSP
jgi:hypothetical protein